jgi:uncharacterized protein
MKNQHQNILNAEEKNLLLKKIIEEMHTNENIKFAYLFGSFLSSDDEKKIFSDGIFNDIDIALYFSNSFLQHQKINNFNHIKFETDLEIKLEEIVRFPVDVRIINYSPLSFQYNVIRSGLLFLDKDDNMRADFEGLVYKKYFDYAYLRNEYLRSVKDAAV